jgi:hypothetical protein
MPRRLAANRNNMPRVGGMLEKRVPIEGIGRGGGQEPGQSGVDIELSLFQHCASRAL